MLKKIQAEHSNYISRTKNNSCIKKKKKEKKKPIKEEKKEEIEYLLHKRALLMKEYFRIQRSLFISLQPKILYLQKRSS